MNDRFQKMLDVCHEMAEKTNDPLITQRWNHTKQQLEAAHTPTAAVIGMGPVGHALLDAAEKFCNAPLPAVVDRAFEHGPACLALEHSETQMLVRITDVGEIPIEDAKAKQETGDGADELRCRFPCDALENRKLYLCGGVTGHEAWSYLLEDVDVLVLRVNATAAMNQEERNWLDQELIPLFGKKHAAVWIDLMDQLNTEEDQADVLDMMAGVMKKRALEMPVFVDKQDVCEWMRTELEQLPVEEAYPVRVLRIFLKDMESRIEELQQADMTNGQAVSKAVQELDAKRGQLELAGEIAADTTVVNAYENLKREAKIGVRDFNEQAVESICKKIETATFEELENMEPKIQSYLRKIWERYQQQMNAKLNEETAKCYAQLMNQMEKDAGKLFAEMDDETRNIIAEAIGKPVQVQGGVLIRPDWEIQGSNGLTKLKVEARNMMLLAIPIAFTSPLLAVATLYGAKQYKKIQTEKRGDVFRSSLQKQVRASCAEILEDICGEVDRNFDDAAGKIASSVRGAYTGLADQMIDQLNQLAERQSAFARRADALRQMRSVTIPGMLCTLD